MSLLLLLLLIVLGGIATAFVVILFAANARRILVTRAAAAASAEQLQRVYAAVEGEAGKAKQACLLCRSNLTADDGVMHVAIPSVLQSFPWAGKTVMVTVGETVALDFTEVGQPSTHLAGKTYQPVCVPCRQAPTGAFRNCFSPGRFLADNEVLQQALTDICQRYPRQLLAYLLCIGTENVHYEAVDQARLGGEAAWMRTPNETALCPHCAQPLRLILQLPGSVLGDARHHEATLYWLGCGEHEDHTELIAQYA